MGRKKKGSKKKYGYRDARMAFYKQNYTLAEKILRQAHIKPDEAGEAKQLKVKILQHKAFDAFEQKNYEGTIELAQATFNVQAKSGYPLPLEKSSILVGIAQLYLGEYVEAANYLSVSTQHEYIQGFRFYELLALLYQHAKNTDYTTFQKQYEEDYATLAEDRKVYLNIAYHLVRNEQAAASQLLENYKHTSHSHLLNNKALQAILTDGQVDESPKLKGLYKVLLEIPLAPNEQAYLAYFDECEAYFEENYTQSLEVNLQSKLEIDAALTPEGFRELLKRTKPEEQPFVVYNQIAITYNDEEYNLALRMIKQHEKQFFQIPESLWLFICTATQADNARQSLVLKTLNTYLDDWASRYTTEQLDTIGWTLNHFMLSQQENVRSNTLKIIQQILQKQASMIGLKAWGICYYSMQTEGLLRRQKPMPQLLDVFSYPNLKDNQEAFIREIKGFLHEFLGLDSTLTNIFGKKKTGDYLLILKRMIGVFNKAIYHSTIHAKSKQTALATYKMLHEYTDKALDVFVPESVAPIYRELKDGYAHALIHFKEDHPDSPHFKAFQAMELAPEIEALKALLKESYFRAMKAEYKRLIQEGKDVVIIKALTEQVSKMRFEEQEADQYGGLLRLLVDDNPNTAIERMNALMDAYDDAAANGFFVFNARKFHAAVLKFMLVNKDKRYLPIMLAYIQRYQDEFTTVKAPVVYNTLGAFLEHIIRLEKKHKNLSYDKELVQALIDYLGRIAKERKLKGLTNKHKKFQTFFN